MYKFQKSFLFLNFPFCKELADELNIQITINKHQGIITFSAESEQVLNFYKYKVRQIMAQMHLASRCYKGTTLCA